MEDVLAVYIRPYDERRPQVCVDEMSKQLISERGFPCRCSQGRWHVTTTNTNGTARPTCSWRANRWRAALFLRTLVNDVYPQAEKIILVMDNLNTHTPAALYEAFPAAEARQLVEKFEFHYTPKHGSWLNMAEIELSVLSRQCVNRRIGSRDELEREVAAWQAQRNARIVRINWRFTTEDARIKLKRLYPSFED